MANEVSLALVGLGRWGTNYLSALRTVRGCALLLVSDCSKAALRTQPPSRLGAASSSSLEGVLASPVEGVIIATPSDTHARIAEACLRSGKHVLVEKPLALNTAEARSLGEMSEDTGRVLLVGHKTLLSHAFTSALRAVNDNAIGRVRRIHAQRTSLGAARDTSDVIWELGPHDVAATLRLFGRQPRSVRAWATSRIVPPQSAVLLISFDDGDATISLSRLGPSAVRKTEVEGQTSRLFFDEVANKMELSGSSAVTNAEQVRAENLLARQCSHFVECIKHGTQPRSGWRDGVAVVSVLAAAQRSVSRNGEEVFLQLPESSCFATAGSP